MVVMAGVYYCAGYLHGRSSKKEAVKREFKVLNQKINEMLQGK